MIFLNSKYICTYVPRNENSAFSSALKIFLGGIRFSFSACQIINFLTKTQLLKTTSFLDISFRIHAFPKKFTSNQLFGNFLCAKNYSDKIIVKRKQKQIFILKKIIFFQKEKDTMTDSSILESISIMNNNQLTYSTL